VTRGNGRFITFASKKKKETKAQWGKLRRTQVEGDWKGGTDGEVKRKQGQKRRMYLVEDKARPFSSTKRII